MVSPSLKARIPLVKSWRAFRSVLSLNIEKVCILHVCPALLPCAWIRTVPDCLGGKSALRPMFSCREWKTSKTGGLEGTSCDMVNCKEDNRDFVESWCQTVEACVRQGGNGSGSQRGKDNNTIVEVDIKW